MQPDLFAGPDTYSGKTYREVSAVTAEKTLLSWLEQWLEPTLLYQKVDGKTPELLLDQTASWNGACWTRSGAEHAATPEQSRKDAVVCSLSSILETGPVESRYFLSPRACQGILRRAEKRGKELPQALRSALQAVASQT
jgi:hypothetical protein